MSQLFSDERFVDSRGAPDCLPGGFWWPGLWVPKLFLPGDPKGWVWHKVDGGLFRERDLRQEGHPEE